MDLSDCLIVVNATLGKHGAPPAEAPSEAEETAILDLARVVARSVERKAAPLVSFSVGRAVAGLDGPGRLAAVRAIVAVIGADVPGTTG